MFCYNSCSCCVNQQQSTTSYSESSAFDYLSSIIIDTTPQHGRHFFDVNCQVCTGKIPDPLYDDDRKSSITARATSGVETAEDSGAAPAVVSISRDPRRSRAVQMTNTVTAVSAAKPKTELVKSEPPPKSEPSPSLQEAVITEPVKSELPLTPKSPLSSASVLVPPLPAYQL